MKNLIARLFFIILAAYIGLGLFLFLFQNSYIYFPDDQDFSSCQYFKDSQKLDLNGTRAYFKEDSRNLIVFYHGNAGSACDRSFLKDEFEKLNYSYIFIEYAGYSNDSKKPSKELLMRDVENINGFLKEKGFKNLILAGESIGAYFALYHSSMINENGVMMISPFENIAEVAKKHYPFYPIALMLREKYDSSEWVGDVDRIVIIHGSQDNIIPIEQSKELFNKISTDNKEFIEISGAGHNDLYYFPETFTAISGFLKK